MAVDADAEGMPGIVMVLTGTTITGTLLKR